MKDIKLTDFYGENVIYCRNKVLALAKLLYSSEEFEPKILFNIVNIFETTTDKWLDMW